MKRLLALVLVFGLIVTAVPFPARAAAYHESATLTGIDVSEHQGQIDWEKVKADGIDFAIIRCGYGMDMTSQDDRYFERNVSECERLGIPYGVYIYSYATTVERALSEAEHVLRLVEGLNLSYPVYYDMEDASTIGCDLAAIATAFCNKITAAGYPVGVYANLNWWNNYLTDSCFDNWHRWVAQYNSTCQYTGEYAMWQYTSSGSVDGISGRVDMNYLIGYPKDHGTNEVETYLRTDRDTYRSGDAILTTASAAVSGAWVAVYGADEEVSASQPSYYWYYVNGSGSGYGVDTTWLRGGTYNIYDGICNRRSLNGTTVTGALPAGEYKVVLLCGDYEVLAQKDITVTEGAADDVELTTDKTVYAVGEDIQVTAVSYKDGAWVGIYPGERTSFNSGYIYYYYTECQNGLTMTLQEQTANTYSSYLALPAGTYTVALFADDGYSTVDAVVYITISDASLMTDKTTYDFGEKIWVSTNYTGTNAWVGMYGADEPVDGSVQSIYWYYIAGASNPVDILQMTNNRGDEFAAGDYKLVLFADNGYTVVETVNISVNKRLVSTVTVEATCKAAGSITNSYSDGTKDVVVLPKLEHTYTAVVTDPDCVTEGYTTYVCTACGNSYIGDSVVATGHTLVKVEKEAADCTTAGNIEYYTCACGAWFYDADGEETIVNHADVVTPALEHSYGEWMYDGAAAHTKSCSRDASHTVTEACSFGEGVVIKDAKSGNAGILEYTCIVCGGSRTEEFWADAAVIRVYGSDRYETAMKAADQMKENLGIEKFQCIVVACGDDFADALSGSYLANQKNAPILLVRKQNMDQIKNYIKQNLNAGGTVYILGGTSAVPAQMEDGLDGYNVKRLGGSNRYETNLLILQEAGISEGDDILVCTGKNFADSLSASAVNKPILLVQGSLTEKQRNLLSSVKDGKLYIIGGVSAVSEDVENALSTYGSTERIGGATRYQTSVMVAQKFFPKAAYAVVAYATNFPDGLCGGPLAYSVGAPLLLTVSGKESAAVSYAAGSGITSGAVLGGPGIISDKTVRAIFAMDTDAGILIK